MKRILSLLFSILISISVITSCATESFESIESAIESSVDDSSAAESSIDSDSSADLNESSQEESDFESLDESVEESSNANESFETSDEESVTVSDGEFSDDVSEENDTSDDVSDENDTSDDVSEPINPPENETKEIVTLFDSSNLQNYNSPFLPSYAPFALYDTTLFANTVITSISFPFDSLASGYTVDSEKLYMPIYVVKSDFSTSKNDCTVENGKKVILDFTGKLNGVKRGDWITVDNLNITVNKNETLAFGDTDMAVLPMFLRDNSTYGFWNRIFGSKGGNNHSLIFKIEGYKTEDENSSAEDDELYISFLGDSISTYSGWSNNISVNNSIGGNKIWYPNNNYTGANLSVNETWWYQVAEGLGYNIAVNNSWSGSVVNTAQTYNVRAKNLHNTSNGAKPVIVVIFMGVNDYAAGATVGSFDGKSEPPLVPTNFSEAYGRTIKNILDTYEGVEIYCCTFLPDRKRFAGSVNNAGINESEYNNVIRKIASNMGVHLIDLYNDSGINGANISSYTVDKLHPNKDGMKLVAQTIINEIR